MSIHKPSFIEILKFDLPEVGSSQTINGNQVFVNLVRSNRDEILVTRYSTVDNDKTGWQTSLNEICEAIQRMDIQCPFEIQLVQAVNQQASFIIKSKSIDAELTEKGIALKIRVSDNTTLTVLELLDEIYK